MRRGAHMRFVGGSAKWAQTQRFALGAVVRHDGASIERVGVIGNKNATPKALHSRCDKVARCVFMRRGGGNYPRKCEVSSKRSWSSR